MTTTEVLHMECRETGEFAHRETTLYEQTETFNDELVAEEKGNEEYVHMKSIDDEYEFLDSNMPKKDPPPEQEQEQQGEEQEGSGSPHTPYSPGGGGVNSPAHRAEEKPLAGHGHDTAMHELNVSDDDERDRFGEICMP